MKIIVKVAINTGPDEAIWKVVEQVAKDKYHLDVEVVSFNDYVLQRSAEQQDVVPTPSRPCRTLRRSRKNAAINLRWSVKPLSSYRRLFSPDQNISELPEGRR